jgi:NADPH-dependent glutamate synthase beta subunit-like oxidoreductase/Pyruvate/2-oxoacid:ferredoxin oxidoreductase delta subunit
VDVKTYVGLIAAGRFERALEVVRRRNPLPGICGRVCTHPCESECNRARVEDPVAICALKRFISDYELARAKERNTVSATPSRFSPVPLRVAIVGSGPAGLTAANDLALAGVKATIFEALPKTGGMLRYGIPPFRLPRDILDVEIAAVQDAGVEIRTDTRVGSPGLGLPDLLKDFEALFLAVGAHKGLRLGIPGEEGVQGVYDAIDWFRRWNLGEKFQLGKRVVVVGGGNSAVDAARLALRLKAREVTIAYRRSRAEMPADPHEVMEAEEEGVRLRFLVAPVRIEAAQGKVQGLVCQKMELGKPDASGRRRPVPLPGTEHTIPADSVIAAISQVPEAGFLKGSGVKIKRGRIAADPQTQATSKPKIFAGGDAVTGPATVIEAIAAGHRATEEILRSFSLADRIPPPLPSAVEKEAIPGIDAWVRESRRRHPVLAIPKRRRSFKEVNQPFLQEDAMAEAARCMWCGPCSECVECVNPCEKRIAVLGPGARDAEGVLEEIVRVSLRSEEISHGQTLEVEVDGEGGKTLQRLELVVAIVDEKHCRACGRCVENCATEAVSIQTPAGGIPFAKVNPFLCRGCGACAAVCITGAARLGGFSDAQVLARVRRDPGKAGDVGGAGPS